MDEQAGGRWHAVLKESEMPDSDPVPFSIGDFEIAVYRVEGNYYATSNICTHAQALLSDGFLDGHLIECPIHNGCFDIRTGQAMSSPVEIDLDTFQTRVVEGRIEVLLPERP
jgi:nitrite reductase/ring-hydroxylating ferredoxin subunit